MAERTRDDQDRRLEQMFASPPIADDGFSAAVVRRVRRRMWIRRLTLPVATLIGTAVSFQPVMGLFTTLSGLVQLIPQDMLDASAMLIPRLPMIVLGAMLLATAMVGLRALED